MSHAEERNHENTVFVGDLDQNVDETLLWELMIQVGPVVSVYIPRDKLTKEHGRFGFVEFASETDVDYACKVMNGISLYNQPIRVNRSGRDRKLFDIGANLFIGNLDPEVDDRHITETFKHFGQLLGPAKVSRDDSSGVSKGFAFVYYDSFEAADAAIAAMNGQFFGGKRINVNYSFKKDKPGERHGDAAERMLAAKNPVTKHRNALQAAAGGAAPGASAPSSVPPPMTAQPPPFGMAQPPGPPPPFVPPTAAAAGYGAPPPSYGGRPYMPPGQAPYPPMHQYGMPPPQHYQPPPMAYPPPMGYPAQPYGQYPPR